MNYSLRQLDLFTNAANELLEAMHDAGDGGKGKGRPKLR